VRAVAFAPRGDVLASGGDDRVLRLWSSKTGRALASLPGHQDQIWGLAFAPDGRTLASASKDKTVRLWRASDGAPLRVLRGHREMVWGLAFGPRSELLVSGSTDKQVRLWDLRGGLGGIVTAGHDGMVVGVDFSPDGKLLASGGKDHSVKLWDVAAGRPLRQLLGHRAKVWAVSFSPDGKLLASGSSDHTLRLWDVAAGRQRRLLLGHQGTIFDLRFSPDGRRLASAGNDGTVRLWDATSGRSLQVLRGHRGPVHGVDLRRVAAGVAGLTAPGYLVASGSSDRTVRLWEAATGRQLVTLRGHRDDVWGVALAPDASSVLSGSADRTLRLWSTTPPSRASSRPVSGRVISTRGRVYWPAFRGDGGALAAATSEASIKLCARQPWRCVDLRGHRGEVNVVRFSRDGALLASSSDDGTVRTWRLPGKRARLDRASAERLSAARPLWRTTVLLGDGAGAALLHSHRGWERLDAAESRPLTPKTRWQRVIAADAERAAALGRQYLCLQTRRRLQLWDRRQDRRLATHQRGPARRLVAHHRGCVTHQHDGRATLYPWGGGSGRSLAKGAKLVALAVSRDGALLAVQGGQVRALLDGRRQPIEVGEGVTALTASKRWLVLGRRDGTLRLLDLAGKPARVAFAGTPASAVTRLALGAADTMAAGFADGRVGLWNLTSGRRLATTRLHGPVQALSLRASRLIAVSELGSAVRWDLTALDMPYCELLRRVWRGVPVVWERGRAVLRSPPAAHRCLRR
jgi:WD40 repeat protein